MNYMKKFFKNNWLLLSGIFLVCLAIILLIVLQIRNNKKLEFITFLKEYYIEFEDETYLNTNILCSRKDTMYLDSELINDAYLVENDTKEEYLLKINEINRIDLVEYNNIKYYNYEVKLLIPFSLDSTLSLDNCFLRFDYLNEEKLEFKLGKVFFYDMKESVKALTIRNLKGIVNSYDNVDTLCGIVLSLSKEKETVKITNIDSLNDKILVNAKEIKVLSSTDIDVKEQVSNILGHDYSIYEEANESEILYTVDDQVNLFLPLSYLEKVKISTLGLIITYELDGKEYCQIIEPFKFFKSTEEFSVNHFIYDFN